MSRCRIERTLANVSDALQRARQETLARGGAFDGDLASGRYTIRTPLGAVEGTYAAEGTRVLFVIEKKPALVPCALIERVIDEFLSA
jgi:hypothetical protein